MPKILKEKLDEYKLKEGPWINLLKKGVDYTSPTGEILVKAESVLDYTNCTEKNVLILDMPTVACLDRVKSSLLLNDPSSPLDFIIHTARSEILHSEPYMQWLRDTYKPPESKCIHLFLDETYPNIDLQGLYDFQAQLNLVDDRMFKLLPAQLQPFRDEMEARHTAFTEIQTQIKILQGQTNMLFKLRPQVTLDLSKIIKLDNHKARNEVFEYYNDKKKQRFVESKLYKQTLQIFSYILIKKIITQNFEYYKNCKKRSSVFHVNSRSYKTHRIFNKGF